VCAKITPPFLMTAPSFALKKKRNKKKKGAHRRGFGPLRREKRCSADRKAPVRNRRDAHVMESKPPSRTASPKRSPRAHFFFLGVKKRSTSLSHTSTSRTLRTRTQVSANLGAVADGWVLPCAHCWDHAL
jgi:hypothetical protein